MWPRRAPPTARCVRESASTCAAGASPAGVAKADSTSAHSRPLFTHAQAHHADGHVNPIPPMVDVGGSPDNSRSGPGGLVDTRDARPSRSEFAMADTPSGKAASLYRFYCPLCMLYFKSIHRMSCCEQYVCSFCFAEYGHRHSIKLPSLLDTEGAVQLPASLACPCCTASGREIFAEPVKQGEQPRSYDDSPRTKASMPAITESLLSPVKVGESFDDMRRKMLTFEAAGYRSTTAGSGGLVTASRGQPTVAPPPLLESLAEGAPGAAADFGAAARPARLDLSVIGSPNGREQAPAAARSQRAFASPHVVGRVAPVQSPGAAYVVADDSAYAAAGAPE